jgi:hypothetical protein
MNTSDPMGVLGPHGSKMRQEAGQKKSTDVHVEVVAVLWVRLDRRRTRVTMPTNFPGLCVRCQEL